MNLDNMIFDLKLYVITGFSDAVYEIYGLLVSYIFPSKELQLHL